jgi:hypothetical protein
MHESDQGFPMRVLVSRPSIAHTPIPAAHLNEKRHSLSTAAENLHSNFSTRWRRIHQLESLNRDKRDLTQLKGTSHDLTKPPPHQFSCAYVINDFVNAITVSDLEAGRRLGTTGATCWLMLCTFVRLYECHEDLVAPSCSSHPGAALRPPLRQR